MRSLFASRWLSTNKPTPPMDVDAVATKIKQLLYTAPPASIEANKVDLDKEYPFACNHHHCRAKFSSPADLHRHAQMHSDNHGFECSVCSVKFNWRSDLINHQKQCVGKKH